MMVGKMREVRKELCAAEPPRFAARTTAPRSRKVIPCEANRRERYSSAYLTRPPRARSRTVVSAPTFCEREREKEG